MNTMNKIHEYRGYKFNIKVELNFRIEKCIGGKREHRITINDLGPSNYYHSHFAETVNLEEFIGLMVGDAEKWVDKQINADKSYEQLILISMGFN